MVLCDFLSEWPGPTRVWVTLESHNQRRVAAIWMDFTVGVCRGSLAALQVPEIPSVISAGGGEESPGSDAVNRQSIVRPARQHCTLMGAACGQV